MFGYLKDTTVGGGLEYEHRVNRWFSGWASGRIGYDWVGSELEKAVEAGVRFRF